MKTVKENDQLVTMAARENITIDPSNDICQSHETIEMPRIIDYFKIQKFLISDTGNSHDTFEMEQLNQDLCKTKTMLDKYYTPDNPHHFSQILNLFDPFRTYKYKLSQCYHGQNVSNGWLKFWELISEFKLIPNSMVGESFITFDNAALSGSGILAINHYIKTATSLKSHVWYACSSINDKTDSYSLMKNYPARWLMDKNNNGDVTNLDNIKNISSKLSDKVHLYTSDLGFDVSEDYNSQEIQHAQCNLGQILLGIHVLKNGGNMITKMYTFFTDFTQSLLMYCSNVFEKLYITKPITSRVTNSECYIVGINFLGIPKDINILEHRLQSFCMESLIPPGSIRKLNGMFLSAAKSIYEAQISSLKQAIDLYENINNDFDPAMKQLKGEAKIIYNIITTIWSQLYPIKSLKYKDRLNCIEVGR